MTEPTNRPAPAITNGDRLEPVGADSLHGTPGHGHQVPASTGPSPEWRPMTMPPPAWQTASPTVPGMPPTHRMPPAPSTVPTAGMPMWVSPPSVPVSVPTVPVASAAPSRPHRRSRTADAALLLAAFVATAGVAFATGRWSAADSPSVAPIRAAFELPAAAAPAAAAGLPAPAALSAVDVNDASATAGPVSAGAISAGTVSAGAASAGRDPVASDDPSVAVSRDPGVRGALAAGPPAAGGLQGPVGAMAGFGPGGLQGTISAIGDGTLALTSADGSVVTVATDASTTYVRETPIEATEVQLGDLVSVQVPFAGPRGQDGAAPDQSLVAEQVTLLPD